MLPAAAAHSCPPKKCRRVLRTEGRVNYASKALLSEAVSCFDCVCDTQDYKMGRGGEIISANAACNARSWMQNRESNCADRVRDFFYLILQ